MNSHSPMQPDETDDTRRIVQENKLLAEQVKRLVRTEYALYNTQLELDNQIQLYKDLYETGRKLSATRNIDEIFIELANFIIDRLNFGGFLVLERRGNGFEVKRSGGCCSDISLPGKSECLFQLFTNKDFLKHTGNEHILSFTSENTTIFSELGSFNFFEKLVIHLFYIGTDKIPAYILIIGNPPENQFYNDLILNSIHMINLGNLVSLIENALNHTIHYQELLRERELLEIKVQERTNDLNNALENLKKLNNRLEILSFQDELTGLYNRRGFYIFGEKFLSMAKRKGTNLLFVYCDLDKFKSINDIHGHKEGDCALQTTASILKNVCRDYDIVSRFGGDEFVILIENVSIDDFVPLKRRISELLTEYNNRSNKGYQILISLGYTIYSPDNTNQDISFDDLIEEADKKLYAEKKKKNEDLH
ncbi:MAG: GGDEF domain-containing protein [Chitinispirillaceae bacterium]|nr:GGDEF domain-containing protein [Chitinispirillaceae bacterium]